VDNKEYVQAATGFLAERVRKAAPETVIGFREWTRSGNVFVTSDIEIPYWSPMSRGVRPLLGLVHALPEYKLYVQALQVDTVAARHIGIVGTARGGRSVTVEELADRLLWIMVASRGGFEFDTREFDRLWQSFIADFQRESVSFVTVAPLPGFTSDVDSISLGPDFEIAKLEDAELSQCLRISIYPGVDLGGVIFEGNYGLRRRFSEEKYFGDVPAEKAQGAVEAFNAMTDSFSHSYDLSGADRERFVNLWKALNGPHMKPFLDAAIRRFAYAGERHRPEDR
jgi:hypothetical protein